MSRRNRTRYDAGSSQLNTNQIKNAGNQIKNRIDRAVKVIDSMILSNSVTGQGSKTDPAKANMVLPGAAIPETVQTALYHGSSIARKIITLPPDSALAKGVKINTPDSELSDKLLMQFDADDIVNKVRKAGALARNYGGAAIVLNIDDGREPHEPVNLSNIKSINSSEVFDARNLMIREYETNVESPNYGQPIHIDVRKETLFSSEVVPTHTSRMIIFRGLDTTVDEQRKRQGWDICVYDLIYDTLNMYNTAFYASSDTLNKANQGIYKITDLHKLLSSDNDDVILARYTLMDKLRSSFRALVIGEGEEFRYESMNINGIADLLDKYTLKLAQDASIPVVILTGQSPAGLSATGESDLRMWNAKVEEYYNAQLKGKLEQIALFYMLNWGVDEPEKWSVEIPSVWNLTPSELTQQRTAVINSDGMQIDKGIYTPEEVAIFRSQENGYDKDIKLTEEGQETREFALSRVYQTAIGTASNPASNPSEG